MADRVGQQLGNYRIVQLLGKGGFADVYLAEHVYLKTQVAVKVLQTRLSHQEDVDNFLREAQIIARLSHPHIVRVLDFGLDGEIPYLVMDYAAGGTLRQFHARGTRIPLPLVISYVKQIAEALQYAHDEKLIHRDIKPENMLLNKRQEVLLSDFGVALIAQSTHYNNTQDVAGTVGYMAPEQIQGKPRAASDQYALGIVVYEWLSGDRPFHGSFTEVCTQHLFAPPPPLREKVPDIAPEVEHLLSVALAKEPKQRFASVQAFTNALAQAGQTLSSTENTTSRAAAVEKLPVQRTPMEHPPAQEEPLKQTSISSQQRAQRNPWRIGMQQLLALVVGIALFALVNHGINLFYIAASNDGFSSRRYQIILLAGDFGFGLTHLIVGLSLLIPCLLAAKFGPWVGSVSAAIGLLFGNMLSDIGSYAVAYWYQCITYAIFGFIAGIAFIRTRGHYTTRDAMRFLLLINVVALFVSLTFQIILDSIVNPPAPVSSFYLPMALVFCLPGLRLVVLLLRLYDKAVEQRD